MSAPTEAVLKDACEALAERDIALARAYEELGPPNWRANAPGYASLARIIAYQQISTSAASAIWGRVCNALSDVSAEAMLAKDEEALRACGLSRPKIRHLRSIAEAIVGGALELEAMHTVPIEAAQSQLVAVKGIGPWTANVYLLTSAGHLDAFPVGDVGLMESYRLLRDDEERLAPKAFAEKGQNWQPFRGVAAHLLWDWINASRGRDTAPPQSG